MSVYNAGVFINTNTDFLFKYCTTICLDQPTNKLFKEEEKEEKAL